MTAIASDVTFFETGSSQLDGDTAGYQSPRLDSSFNSYYQNYPVYFPQDDPQNATNGYYVSVDVSTLSPLVETSLPETAELYAESDKGQRQVYYTPTPGNSACSYHSPRCSDLVLYNSSEEEQARRFSPIEEGLRSHYHEGATMGNGSSVSPESGTKKSFHKQSKNRLSSASSSDNGGFESNTPKLPLGVKEKLRHSLDKISLRAPFRWGSSDKLSRNVLTGNSKSKSKNTRRYSDSATSILAVNPVDDKKKSKKSSSSIEDANARKKKAASRLVRVYSASASTDKQLHFDTKGSSSNNHDYVNLTTSDNKMPKGQSQTPKSVGLDYVPEGVNTNSVVDANEYYAMQNSKTYHHAFDSHGYPTWESNNTATKAKGTWKMLKTAKTKQLPIKASSYPSHMSSQSDTSDSVQALASRQERINDSTDKEVFEEAPLEEPPRLAPVSGKLLMDKKNCENTILRPTAFRPTVVLSNQKSHSSEYKDWDQTHAETTSREDVYSKLDQRGACASSQSNNSDSGRHSATSIPTGVTIGSNFSCSGSEGYESARVSSSTTHSAMQEHDCNGDSTTRLSPKRKLTDDVMISDLESRVKERQDEVLLLRRNLEDNEKTLHEMVYEDRKRIRESDIKELKQKYSSQLKSQLEDRIKTMTDAIDAQSRQNEDIAELKARLEEGEIEMQQKHGEISLLKRQVKEAQTDLNQRSSEAVALKSYNRELVAKLTQRESEAAALKARLNERDLEITELEKRLATASSRGSWSARSVNSSVFRNSSSNEKKVINEANGNSRSASICSDIAHSDCTNLAPSSPLLPPHEAAQLNGRASSSLKEKEDLLKRLHAAEHRCAVQERQFEQEKRQWIEDKRKVIKYQKQLQDNYVQMYKRCHALEREVNMLTSQLQAVDVSNLGGARVNENYPEHHDISYPMEI